VTILRQSVTERVKRSPAAVRRADSPRESSQSEKVLVRESTTITEIPTPQTAS